MSTVAQIEANRSNAQLSTGPASSAGIARSAQNARIHGITMNIANLQGEELAAYNELLDALIAEFQPKGALEHRCVREMAAAEWRLESIAVRQQSLIMGDLDQNARALSLLLRYESAARRAFERANAMFRQNRIKPLPVEHVRRRLSAEEREARLEQVFGKTELSRIRGEEGSPEEQLQNEPNSARRRR